MLQSHFLIPETTCFSKLEKLPLFGDLKKKINFEWPKMIEDLNQDYDSFIAKKLITFNDPDALKGIQIEFENGMMSQVSHQNNKHQTRSEIDIDQNK